MVKSVRSAISQSLIVNANYIMWFTFLFDFIILIIKIIIAYAFTANTLSFYPYYKELCETYSLSIERGIKYMLFVHRSIKCLLALYFIFSYENDLYLLILNLI